MTTLKTSLLSYKKTELESYAKTLGIKRISSLKKAEIAEKVADELLNPEVMAKRLAILDDAQIALFEKAAKGAFMATEAEMDTAYEACALDYMQVSEEGMLEVTEDVAEAYEKMDKETFEKKRKEVSWLAKCLSFSAAMYGVAPVDTVRTVYESRPHYHTEKIKIEVSSRKTTPCNYTAGEKNSLFFTGGVDATSALVSTFSKKPLLINIWGGDLRLTDQDSHAELEQYLKRLTQAMGLEFCFVKTNARSMFPSVFSLATSTRRSFHPKLTPECLSSPAKSLDKSISSPSISRTPVWRYFKQAENHIITRFFRHPFNLDALRMCTLAFRWSTSGTIRPARLAFPDRTRYKKAMHSSRSSVSWLLKNLFRAAEACLNSPNVRSWSSSPGP